MNTEVMTVQELVSQSTLKPVDEHVAELIRYYDSFVPRSRRERQNLRAQLSAAGDGALLDTQELFNLPSAWRDNFPAVAIAPYKARVIHYSPENPGRGFREYKNGYSGELVNKTSIPVTSIHGASAWYSGDTHVPLVPKSLIPWNPLTRRNLYVLFDVPSWHNIQAIPVDPYLLQRMGKTRFRVLAHWDLSDKERNLMNLLRALK